MNRLVRPARILCFAVAIFALVSNLPAQSRRTAPHSATPPPVMVGEPSSLAPARPPEPMPLPEKIAIVVGGLVLAAGVLILSLRAWRSSNLFDRQYRFPEIESIAARLGAARSGGCLALLQFETHDATGVDDAAREDAGSVD